jgi:hypothetical protein
VTESLNNFEKFKTMDPVFMAACVGLVPDDWQETVLRTDENTLINICRQAGKSTFSALKAYHKVSWSPGSTVVMVSRALRQSGELFRKFIGFHQRLDIVETLSETKLTADFANGSRVISLPGAEGTIRGISAVDLLIVDEAARVPDDLYVAVRPMLATTRGQLVAPSTPFGERGWWWKSWMRDNGWLKLEVPAELCPRIDPAFLEEERRELGDLAYRQEYCCEFIQLNEALFRPADIVAAMSGGVKPLPFAHNDSIPPASVLHSEVKTLFPQ